MKTGEKAWLRGHLFAAARILRMVQNELRLYFSKPSESTLGFTLRGGEHQVEGSFEPRELDFVQAELGRVDAFVDVGANVGLYTCLAGKTGTTAVAVEPLPENLRFLLRNLRDNDLDDVIVYPVALQAKPGVVTIHGSRTGASLIPGWAGARQETIVPAMTLDGIVAGAGLGGKKALIKVDAEGSELRVLEGATRTLTGDPAPVWLVEVVFDKHHPAGRNPDFVGVFETFWDAGYEAFSLRSGRSVARDDVAGWIGVGARGPADLNFVFRRS